MLHIEMKPEKGILFVLLEGQLTKTTIDKFYNEVVYFVIKMGIQNIVIDLQKIKKIDKEGQKALLKNFSKTKEGQKYLYLENENLIKNKNKFNILNKIKDYKNIKI